MENKVYTFWKTRQPVPGKGPHTIYFGKGHMYVLGKRHRAMFLGKEIEKDMLLERGMRKMCFWKRAYSSLTFMGLLFHCFLCSFPKLEVIYTKDFEVFDMNLLNNLRKI